MRTQTYDKPIYECPKGSAIPIVTVKTVDGIKTLKGCFIFVEDINTLYYADNRHNIVVVNAGPVEQNDYDLEGNPLNLRKQILVNNVEDVIKFYYYDKGGNYSEI